MSKRRSAEEALNLPASVKQFIDRGIDAADSQSRPLAMQVSGLNPRNRKSSSCHWNIRRSLHPSRDSRGAERAALRPASAIELSRTYAKATVQKTIRFDPQLIAELEAYTRERELHGEKPVTLQQIQNEALDLWLEKHVR